MISFQGRKKLSSHGDKIGDQKLKSVELHYMTLLQV
jgi:hypothetical protein